MLSALLGIAVTLASLALLLLIARLLFDAARAPLGQHLERRRFERARALARQGDRHLESGDLERALSAFGGAFFLDVVLSDRALAGLVHNHHVGLLSRFIAVTEERQGGAVRLMSLAKVDRLVDERGDLQRRYLAQGGRRGDKAREILSRLRENRRELRAAVRQLVREASDTQPFRRTH